MTKNVKQSLIDNFEQTSNKVVSYCLDSSNYIEPKVYENFVTKEEADYIISKATPLFEQSKILSNIEIDLTIRSSTTAWIHKDDNVIRNIQIRASKLVNLPIENAESLQIVRYKQDQKYNPHHDSCCDDTNICKEFAKRGGNRIRTVLIYLTDDFTGGETIFPNLNNLKIKPPKYSAIVFYPTDENIQCCHPKALHGGLPVISGEKIICNLWFRENAFV